ncbi:Pyridoxamine 5'-phosphate oxidase [Planctomycetes bacterium Poly30]|uniref:Pyridoxamine 5'-phosphate oxidase n=1 Tax=Saltatorellus ferox TaxID=2528018 RepID=A0A518ELK4_9BACT|nr:Pyridoxamine 5'-phosphate oxidase [Planctomycetes bacterium Poly30]
MSDRNTRAEQASMARRLVRSVDGGILSTISVEIEGYPFGSVAPFALTHEGRAVVYVSSIAQHTKNILANPRVCLTLASEPRAGTNRQAIGRVTLVGDAVPVPADHVEAAGERYFQFFPESRAYAGTHDFRFFWIEPRRIRHIAGFGQIFWVEREDWLLGSPDWHAEEAGILEHMNEDHGDAVAAIAADLLGKEVSDARLIAVDPEGFHMRTSDGVVHGSFEKACQTTDDVRQAFIQLVRGARA